jgi:glucose-6-phosphate 1-epimerase
MVIEDLPERLKRFEIPGRVTVMEGNGEMSMVEVTTDHSSAEIYLHGAQVTAFRKKGEPGLLFLSQCSRFGGNHPIRGGIPIVFPWFGVREGMPAHGFARLGEWDLHEVSTVPDGGVTLRFGLPENAMRATLPPFMANYVISVSERLSLELIITNASADQPFAFETCLHTYFAVGDIANVSLEGLEGADYLDALENMAQKRDAAPSIRINGEIDRVYYNTNAAVDIVDPGLGRRVRVEKSGAASTIVWNPWIQKSQLMPDFGTEEYRSMICVESGNVGPNRLVLPPGKSCVLGVAIESSPL